MSRRDLDRYDLEAQEILDLPGRAVMSLINANLAVPINAGIALNLLSDASNAIAGAVQQDPINQGLQQPAPAPEPAPTPEPAPAAAPAAAPEPAPVPATQ